MKILKYLKFNKSESNLVKTPNSSIYATLINGLNGVPINLKEFKEKYILIVNVASECGFTKQYKDLQNLHNTYKDKLVVIGVPCDQFGGQEPGDEEQIQTFCEKNFGVTFILTEKLNVKGKEQHPLYMWLTQKANNGRMNSVVKWNFQKYLVDPNGQLVAVFYSITKPSSNKIVKYLR